jgi:membrane-associated phospholipid phosphatase
MGGTAPSAGAAAGSRAAWFLTGAGRIWLGVESWVAGPWVGLYRLVRPRPAAAPERAAGPDAAANLTHRRRVAVQVPFLASMACLAGLWLPAPPPMFARLAALLAAATALFALSFRVRRWWFDRLLLVAQIVVLDQYFKLLMIHCSHLPAYWDGFFLDVDRALFGTWPIAMGEPRSQVENELWAFVYSLFIPYLFSSLFLNATGRPPRYSAAYFAGITALYGVSYLGYVVCPTTGPHAHPELYSGPLARGRFMDTLQQSLAYTDAFSGAFPSLHTGAVVYMLGVDFLHCRDRFFVYLPLGVSILVSTLTLRQHYLIDLVAGAALAVPCILVCRRLARAALPGTINARG